MASLPAPTSQQLADNALTDWQRAGRPVPVSLDVKMHFERENADAMSGFIGALAGVNPLCLPSFRRKA